MRPDVPEMRAEEAVEFGFKVGIEIIAVPPEPVAPFGGVEFLPGRLRTVRWKTLCDIHQLCASMTEEIPPAIVFVVPDPDLVVRIDPGP
mgnify:CR=1 FL=1